MNRKLIRPDLTAIKEKIGRKIVVVGACTGFDARAVARAAVEDGLLEAGHEGRPYQKRKTPHLEGRFYVVRAHAFGMFRSQGGA